MSRERFARLFRGNEDWYGQYEAKPNGDKIRAWTKAGPIPDEDWDRHLAGGQPGLGIVPINDEGTCYWGCVDLDDDDTDHPDLVRRIKEVGLPFLVCRSKSGGAHLFVFFIEPVKPVHLIAKLKRWVGVLGLENPVDEKGRQQEIEIFPKQLSLVAGQKGNWLNLPYFDGDDTTRYGLDDDGNPLSLDDWLDYAESRRLTELEFETSRAQVSVESDRFFLDGPPCLEALHEQGFARGTRNQGLFAVGVFLKLKYPDEWEDLLREYNTDSGAVDPPLPEDEVETIIKSLGRSDYVYNCSEAPIVGFCKRSACKKREYGIDKFRSNRNHAALPPMRGLTSFEQEGEPLVFELEVDGRSVAYSPDELLSLQLFRKATFRRTKRVVPSLKQHEWETRLSDLLADHTVVEVPPDASPHGQFVARLREFLAMRAKAERDEDVLDNKPWESNGRIYFRSQALIEWLERKRFRELGTSIGIWSALKREGAGYTVLTIAGAEVDVWWVPVPQKGEEQTEDYSERGHDGPDF